MRPVWLSEGSSSARACRRRAAAVRWRRVRPTLGWLVLFCCKVGMSRIFGPYKAMAVPRRPTGAMRESARCATTRIGAGFEHRRKIAPMELLRQIGQQHLAGALLSRIITFAIDEGGGAAYHLDVAFNSATGFGDLKFHGEQKPPLRLFLFLRLCAPSMAGRAGRPSGLPVSVEPVRQPRSVCHPVWRRGWR